MRPIEIPDRWIVLTIKDTVGTFDKVLMGWSGGYLDADRWRVNSSILEVIDEGDAYLFIGATGSRYRCYKTRYGTTIMSQNILHTLQHDSPPGTITISERYP